VATYADLRRVVGPLIQASGTPSRAVVAASASVGLPPLMFFGPLAEVKRQAWTAFEKQRLDALDGWLQTERDTVLRTFAQRCLAVHRELAAPVTLDAGTVFGLMSGGVGLMADPSQDDMAGAPVARRATS
jgi:hypothetical protein